MCLKGGPRCHTHAKADADKALDKRDEQIALNSRLIRQEHNAKIRQENYRGHDTQQIKALEKDRRTIATALKKGRERSRMLADKYNELFDAANATAGGIDELERKISSVEEQGYGAEFLRGDLETAKKTYAHNLEKYDERNGTVDARKPSPYGDFDGIDTLNDRLKANEKKLAALHKKGVIDGSTPELKKKIEAKLLASTRLKGQLRHAYKTEEHRRLGIIPDPKKIAEAEAKAKKSSQDAQDSWNRSDTDGSLSQWASTTMAEHHRMEAELLRNNGKAEFNALFDQDGNIVPAKMISVQDRYNPNRTNQVWAVLSDPDDVDSTVVKWVNMSNASKTSAREAALAKKGYTMGKVLAPAYVTERGNNLVNVRSVFARKDRGFSKDVEVVTKNLYPALIKEDEKRQADFQKQYAAQEAHKAEVDNLIDIKRIKEAKKNT